MHYSKLLIAAAAVFIQGTLAKDTPVRVLAYSNPDCTGTVQDILVDHNQACDISTNPFQSYKENGWGKRNGQKIAFYSEPGCTAEAFLYDTFSWNGDYFHSHQCYNIDGHSPAKFAQGIAQLNSSHISRVRPSSTSTDGRERRARRVEQAQQVNGGGF
ncbi:hypothetical protein FQN51_008697 [Onygenales sp. PD_10]|nr:hypothetical protein FQN51_008697 [Onygenales sp. PD_10]